MVEHTHSSKFLEGKIEISIHVLLSTIDKKQGFLTRPQNIYSHFDKYHKFESCAIFAVNDDIVISHE